jgi:hypothetical protein
MSENLRNCKATKLQAAKGHLRPRLTERRVFEQKRRASAAGMSAGYKNRRREVNHGDFLATARATSPNPLSSRRGLLGPAVEEVRSRPREGVLRWVTLRPLVEPPAAPFPPGPSAAPRRSTRATSSASILPPAASPSSSSLPSTSPVLRPVKRSPFFSPADGQLKQKSMFIK